MLASGGPHGLQPQHIKDMITESAGESGCMLLRALVSLVNFALSVLESVCPFFLGTNLVALNKKDGGVCPITVGNTLRRLIVKCASLLVKDEMAEVLASAQLRYGIKRHAETAFHGAHIFLKNLQCNEVLAER